ncbi:amino acid/amide ABC transporter ATP-binding protein 2, HAAT family [Arboricoccus pini]|uniref:Amino acid/amide ABC transporter ATP-binding protein 2, HAAT family n=1 Tax=Arboricoccus pini TaxID=1963835 RepID=A0A212RHZ9_9PROT|nr:ABC transporter ATP-binding protein [Arboricoccus pini]SNB71978.1 amino acid/amide ABC transporter ATP-binding protein 2, HAAT family [Arboricoccus pini]
MLEIKGLAVSYGATTALAGVALHVEAQEAVCVVGPNGAGKSTLMAAIAGGVSPRAGSITYEGKPILGMRPENIARQGISLVPEGRHVFGTLTVEENLFIGTYAMADRRHAAADAEMLLGYFPRLKERWRQPAGRLSGGEQQMLVIARALMTRPRLLLVDEPSLGLAPKIVDTVYETLLSLRRERQLTLLINEQSSERMLRFSDRIYVIRNGRILLHGRTEELRDGEAIARAYFGFDDKADAALEAAP